MRKDKRLTRKGKNLLNKTFGKLKVIEKVYVKTETRKKGVCVWECLCTCGNKIQKRTYDLIHSHEKVTPASCYPCYLKSISEYNRKKNGGFLPHIMVLYNSYKHGAKKRKLDFKLNRQDIKYLVEQPCYYCGQKPVDKIVTNKAKQYNAKYNGIDRIDNNKGYIKDSDNLFNVDRGCNVVSCCSECNLAKADMTAKEYLKWIEDVYMCMNGGLF